MTRHRLASALLALVTLPTLLLAADGSARLDGGRAMHPDATLLARAQAGDAAAGATLFASDLLAALGRAGSGNLVASPLSVYDVLALLAPGARGTSATALTRALHSTLGDDALLLDVARLRNDLSGGGALRIASAAWLQQDYAIRDAYMQLLTDAGAPPRTADFVHDAEAARLRINDWIAETTEQRIRDVVPPGALTDMTRLVLADAIALDAQWSSPFLKGGTRLQDFHAPGGVRQVDTMHATWSLPYLEGPGFRAVTLPYKGNALQALVVLPEPGVDPLAVLPAALAPGSGGTNTALVQLSLPRFELRSSVDLHRAFDALGLGVLFDWQHVDLSGIAGRPGDLAVDTALHQALLSVDENGTKGAAATVLSVIATSARARPQVTDFTVDRPFLFVVEDTAHGVPVFVARVSDPSRG